MRARKTGLRKSNNFLESTKLFPSHNVLSSVCSQCQVNNYHRLQNFERGAAEQPRHQKSVSWLVLIMHVPAGQKGKKYRKKKKTNKQTNRKKDIFRARKKKLVIIVKRYICKVYILHGSSGMKLPNCWKLSLHREQNVACNIVENVETSGYDRETFN